MPRLKFVNNFSTSLVSDITDTETTLILSSVIGLPTLDVTGDYFLLTLVSSLGDIEIVKVTAVDTINSEVTVVRGQEGTIATTFASDSRVGNRPTAGTFEYYLESWFTRETETATRASDTTITFPADLTDEYEAYRALIVIDDSGIEYELNVVSSSYSAPTTTVTVNTTLPATIAAVELGPDVKWLPQQANASTADTAESIKVSSNDTTPAPLEDKLVAGTNVTLTTQNEGANENIEISVSNLGTIASQDSDSVNITGGTITGITDLTIADGGTGASDAISALSNLGGTTLAAVLASIGFKDIIFTSSGTYTPSVGVTHVDVDVIAAGGGGGSGVTVNGACGSGGSGGGRSRKRIEAADLGATETVTVGAGGVGGTTGGAEPTAGGTSSFGSHCSATGGGAGKTRSTVTSASSDAGGVGSGGDINEQGETGGMSEGDYIKRGGRGGGAPGCGGTQEVSSAAIDGAYPGQGGSGGRRITVNTAGGAGYRGEVRIREWFIGSKGD